MWKTSWITYLSVLVEVDSLLIAHLLRWLCSLKFVCGDREADEKDISKQMVMWVFLYPPKDMTNLIRQKYCLKLCQVLSNKVIGTGHN